MKNTLTDVSDSLFIMLDRLMDDEVCKDEESTEREIKRTKAGVDVVSKIVDVQTLQLEAVKVAAEWNIKTMPSTLGIEFK